MGFYGFFSGCSGQNHGFREAKRASAEHYAQAPRLRVPANGVQHCNWSRVNRAYWLDSHAHSLFAEKLVKALSDDFIYDENRLYIGASIGISLFPEHGKNVDELIKNADLAMYEIKNSGGHGYAFYNDVMNDNVIWS